MSSIEKTLQLRRRRQEVEENPVSDLQDLGNFTVVESNNWKGVRSAAGVILLEPICDDIDVMADALMCIAKVKDHILLYDLARSKFVDLPEIKNYERYDYMLEVSTEEGIGLFNCRTKRMIVPPQFAETTHADCDRYLWIKTADGAFAFYDTNTGAIVKCPENTVECFDATGDSMFVQDGNKVRCLDGNGNYDADKLRHIALQGNGRISLTNHNRHIKVVADVYGNIIN